MLNVRPQTVAIAISSDVFEKMHDVGEVGGIVGAAVSGSFLFLVGLANTVILWRIIMQRRKEQTLMKRRARGEIVPDSEYKPHHNHMLMMRLLGPVMTFVNRPWKMYPVGVLFGFGFDTASSIALLALSAIAKRGADGKVIPSSNIVILPLLFTTGMTLVDSADSILMLYSYAGFPEKSWALFERTPDHIGAPESKKGDTVSTEEKVIEARTPSDTRENFGTKDIAPVDTTVAPALPCISEDGEATFPVPDTSRDRDIKVSRDTAVKMNVMSGLSIVLTLMSILVAFRRTTILVT
ncbi:hypothetical protein C0991_010291 [Blastosporella zonata]|nr:hypothetical protein C0991_010291 [Blastosporella zonata]